MLFYLFKFIFWITGWRIEGNMRGGLKKCVIIIAPHTSFWDYYIGVVSRGIGQFRANYLVKAELFRMPLVGWFLRITGGIPVDRSNKNSTIVDDVVAHFNHREKLILAITPEGTRKKVKSWKTGFYRIALKAKVPIVVVSFDFKLKLVKYIEEFRPTGNVDEEMTYIKSLYKGVLGKHPDLGVD